MSDTSSNGGSRWFLVGALTVMVLGLAWSGWQWSRAKQGTSKPAQHAPAAAPAAPAEEAPAPPPPAEESRGNGEVLIG